jgi:hypothetical protein
MRYIRPKIDKKNFKFVYDGEQKGWWSKGHILLLMSTCCMIYP